VKVTYKITVEANTQNDLLEALERLKLIREGLTVESTYSTRKRGKQWFAEVLITTTPDEEQTHE
jgi:hypothetical protein